MLKGNVRCYNIYSAGLKIKAFLELLGQIPLEALNAVGGRNL